MRKTLLFAVLAMAMAQAWAGNVDATAAMASARQFLRRQAVAGRIMAPVMTDLKLAYTELNSDDGRTPVYYIFNCTAGFVIISGEDRASAILAYGDRPIMDVKQLPANMKYWLDGYKRQLEFLQANPDIQVASTMVAASNSGQSVNPLMTANWSQNAPYWNECPAYGTDTCYTGCPATSLAMVFHYWRYPKQQTPAVPSYMTPQYAVVLPELPPTVFDWDNMLDDYTAGYNGVQAAAVAHLMRYIGQAEEMDYTISGSGAYGKDVLRAVKFFEYDQDAQLLFKTDDLGYANYSDGQWGNLIQNELTAGRPIVYLAYDNTTGAGHAFNVDGYDTASDTYHINWGWNGRGNGFFALNAFTYQDYTFGTGQQMVIGIQPPEDYQNPRIQAYPNVLSMQAYPGKPATAVISLKGTNLTGNLTLSLNDAAGVFSIDATQLSSNVANAGKDITVTYAPTVVGTHTANIVCSSEGADPMTITLNGTAPLEVYPPQLDSVAAGVTLTSFRARWTDETPVTNVNGYTLEVYAKPDYMLLEEADFSDLPKMAPTNQASHATDYLPEGWSFTGTEFNLEGGCVMPRRNGVISTNALSLSGYDKVTVMLTGRSYSSWGDPSELTISTSLASQTIELPFTNYGMTTVVLDCAEGDCIRFTAGYYPMIQAIRIYAGDATAATLRASESGDESYRLITDISTKSYTVSNLAAGGTFFYHVKAHYIDGTESDWSETRIVTLIDGGHDYQVGDVNHDGKVSIKDVTELITVLMNNSEVCPICADVNGDDAISIKDVTALITRLMNGI